MSGSVHQHRICFVVGLARIASYGGQASFAHLRHW